MRQGYRPTATDLAQSLCLAVETIKLVVQAQNLSGYSCGLRLCHRRTAGSKLKRLTRGSFAVRSQRNNNGHTFNSARLDDRSNDLKVY